jgi:hypothetical protein
MLAFAKDRNARINTQKLSKLELSPRREHLSSSFAVFNVNPKYKDEILFPRLNNFLELIVYSSAI